MKKIILTYKMQSFTLIYVEKLCKRIRQKFHLSIKSELLKCLASLLRRLHNTSAEFVIQTNKAFIFDLKLVTVTPLHNTSVEFVDQTNEAFIFDLKLVTVTPIHNTSAEFVEQTNKAFIFDLKLVTITPLHNTSAEFVDQTNKAFIFDLKLVTVTPLAWCCFLLSLELQAYQCLI